MRIVLATPLYPPDVAEPAPYVKELARRLGTLHEVTVVAYTRLPEQIPGVTIVAIDKRASLVTRLAAYTRALAAASRDGACMYAQNGPSVEGPLVFLSLMLRRRFYLGVGDTRAHERSQGHLLARSLAQWARGRATRVITEIPPERPEIIPIDPYPTDAMAAYERAWDTHVRLLLDLFAYGC